MKSNAVKHMKKQQDTVTRILEQFRPVVAKAVNDGVQLGIEETRRSFAEQLAGLDPANSVQRKPRDKTVKGVVECPVVNCKHPGIKPLHCFCQMHYDLIPATKRKKLREQQLERRAAAAAAKKEKGDTAA